MFGQMTLKNIFEPQLNRLHAIEVKCVAFVADQAGSALASRQFTQSPPLNGGEVIRGVREKGERFTQCFASDVRACCEAGWCQPRLRIVPANRPRRGVSHGIGMPSKANKIQKGALDPHGIGEGSEIDHKLLPGGGHASRARSLFACREDLELQSRQRCSETGDRRSSGCQ